jgi:putative transposase
MSNKNVAVLRVVDRDDVAELPELSEALRLALADVVGAAREGLLAMSVGVGLRVFAEMMEDELTAKIGAKHAKLAGRTASRHGAAAGSVVLGGRRVSVTRPRARTAEGTEVALDTYAAFADDDLLQDVVMEHICSPAWRRAGTGRRMSRWEHRSRRRRARCRSRPSVGASWPERKQRWRS